MDTKIQVVIVGNGMVGHHFVEQLSTLRESPEAIEITVLSGEPRLAYDRVHLSEFFAGKTADDLAMTDEETYDAWQVNYKTGAKVTHIDRENKAVTTESGEVYSYDKLVLATGSYAFVPPIPGKDQEHCLVYRTIEDLHDIKATAEVSKVGVVIGGGLLGLEAANALKQLGLETHVVEFAPRLMGVQLDDGGGRVLKSKIEGIGVHVHCSKATEVIEAGETSRYRLKFTDGEVLETDMVLFSAGIRPYDNLAREFDLEVGERGGIVVNDQCQTSDPDIYAIGECALWNNFIYGLVAPGYSMAKVAAAHLMGEEKSFQGADMSTKLKLMGIDVGSIGDALCRTPDALTYTYDNQPENIYKKIVVSADKSKLLGAVLVGDTSEYDSLLQYMLNGIELPESPDALILPSAGEKPTLGADALPDSATICSCLNVTKGNIIQAIDSGAETLADIKSITKATTGCGGCASLLKNVFDKELESRGIEVKKDICEHFAYSRAELYNIVQVEGIRTFDELLKKHGKGLGCDICKPAAGSILASVWNDYVLNKKNLPLQDTNDTYLANMQKDGSYSVIPRIQGGEITPDKLLVLAQVAKKYDLYTKLTGGQRIALFGARKEQLPAIWDELIQVGFETGQAYGKSLRTAKSCVGSMWCRYGVQDSVTMAITMENRYKGLRAPHKFKLGVSGCTRECAEAQGKDIGVIATDKGWNLYVCGNGGMKPRHADLFATDLDDETLIKYVDRVLMFYIKTADKLERTSVWMDNLEGGLDYLKKVVIDDHLGICAELDKQMEHIVETFQCEWKTTLSEPQVIKRFRSFINTDEVDTNIEFVRERDQIRPIREEERIESLAVEVK
ncbi:nitrite reductase large subunit NirB [Vibrio hannami]|uniref:nitrite reductase large subunit NirB n=1 Tax=Vibrio hannami TaxID=2717094 RepID=UPI00240FA0EE|nr:nitrite reductase large subunit NirB [Vibrio hannami]MDG3087499.1 nitrite reductase large subunit NirB [Vibrio hannami]